MKFDCQHLLLCSGCFFKSQSFEEQQKIKIQNFLSGFCDPLNLKEDQKEFLFPTQGYHRHRGDFICFDEEIGLYDTHKNLFPVKSCSLLDPELNSFLQSLGRLKFKVKKGTIRIRKSPKGGFGIWIDFSNLDIKRLLEEKEELQKLLAGGVFVEVGQKGKRLGFSPTGDSLKLLDPEPQVWFKSKRNQNEELLYGLISSFTQPSYDLNLLMLEKIEAFGLALQSFDNLIEFGAGIGNFSVFLSSFCQKLFLIENDSRNLLALEKNLQNLNLSERTQILQSEKDYGRLPQQGKSLIFVNPPKSGVGSLFDQKLHGDHLVYVSCYLDSMKKDIHKLLEQGFKIKKSILFDQFPQANHFETLTYLERF